MNGKSSDTTLVYTEGGTVAHYIDAFLQSPNESTAKAMCGRTPWPGYWFGTGSQDEEERAMGLEVCTPCRSAMNFRLGGAVNR